MHQKIYAILLLSIISLSSQADNNVQQKPQISSQHTRLTFGFMTNYNIREFNESSRDKLGDFGLALIRLGLESRYDDFVLSARYHWYNGFNAVHHAWVGYNTSENLQIQAGVIRVPFGLLPYAAHTFWLGVPYYVGKDDDNDAGLSLTFIKNNLDLRFSITKNEELGNSTSANRYSTDVIRDSDKQQYNEEVNQINLRGSYNIQHQYRKKTEIGFSLEWGQLYNTNRHTFGDHWAAGLHLNRVYYRWQFQFEAFKYQYNPDNSEMTSKDTILMGMLGAKAEIASKGTVYVANIARDILFTLGPINKMTCYNDFSVLQKAKETFSDSKLNVMGCLVKAGPVLAFIDFMSAKNMTFFDEASSMGSGGDNQWKHRANLRLGYFFK